MLRYNFFKLRTVIKKVCKKHLGGCAVWIGEVEDL